MLKKQKRKRWMLFWLIFTFLGMSVAFGKESSTPEARVMALSGNTGLAMVHQIEQETHDKGPFQYTIVKSPDVAMAKIIAGEADIAALPLNQAALLYNKGAGVQVASIIGWGVLYLVGNDPAVKHWKDLKGKELSVAAKGAVPDVLFRYLVMKNGLNPDRDLQINYVASPVELAQLTLAGKANLAVLPEPWVTQVLEADSRLKVLLNFQTEWSRVERQRATYPQSCIVVNRKFAKEQPRLVKRYLKELERSIAWLRQNPVTGGALAEKYVQVPATAVQKGLERCNLQFRPVGKVKTEIRRFLERIREVAPDAIGGKVPDEGFYYQP